MEEEEGKQRRRKIGMEGGGKGERKEEVEGKGRKKNRGKGEGGKGKRKEVGNTKKNMAKRSRKYTK